jgi:signal transduction histidine kinase
VLLRDWTPILDLQNALDKRYREEWLPASLQNVAHQLRSLLQGMKLRVELLAADNGEAKDRHIGRLRKEIARLDQAVDLLASGKLTE